MELHIRRPIPRCGGRSAQRELLATELHLSSSSLDWTTLDYAYQTKVDKSALDLLSSNQAKPFRDY